VARQLIEKETGTEQLAAREAMVAARLAQGFLAIRFRESWREDALEAFAAAKDEEARVGFDQSSTKLFGSPMLAAVLSRPDMKGLRVAAEERQLRGLMTQVAEGIATLKLGSAEASARQVKAALEYAERLPAGPPIDAGQLLDRKEDDARAVLRERTRALAVLTLLESKEPEAALREALKLSPVKLRQRRLEDLAASDIGQAAQAVRDPLGAFALALAMEEFAVTRLEQGSPEARALLGESLNAQRGAQDLLTKSRSLRELDPQLEVLVRQSLARLTQPGNYVAQASALRHQAQVAVAVRKVEEGLRRHPDDNDLKEQRILLKLDEADFAPGRGQQVVKGIVTEADRASKGGILRSAGSLIALGEAHERLEQVEQALDIYRRALNAAPLEEERLKASVRIAVLSARLDLKRPPQPKE
jgi:tetratricopeptide (TPR) repeat protein